MKFLLVVLLIATWKAADGIKCYDCDTDPSAADTCSTVNNTTLTVVSPNSTQCMWVSMKNATTGSLVGFGRRVANASMISMVAVGGGFNITLPGSGCNKANSSMAPMTMEVCVCNTDLCTALPPTTTMVPSTTTQKSHATSISSGFLQLIVLAIIAISSRTLI